MLELVREDRDKVLAATSKSLSLCNNLALVRRSNVPSDTRRRTEEASSDVEVIEECDLRVVVDSSGGWPKASVSS
jgi:hypothetical protein